MYVWLWRKLPGGTPGKLVGSVLLLAGVLALLLFVVFPWAEPRLPFNNVNVDQPAHSVAPAVTSSSLGLLVSPTSTALLQTSGPLRA